MPSKPLHYGSFSASAAGINSLANARFCAAGKSAIATRIDAKLLEFLSDVPSKQDGFQCDNAL
ncbi:MAG: hypothetical protein ACP5VQ_05760 [Phycisphaerae bacterium]